MINVETVEIKGHDDFELNIKRDALLTYHMAYDDEKTPDGIIFTIPGFGDDTSVSYQKNLIKHIASRYNLLAVFVEYHAIFSRPSQNQESAEIVFSSNDTEMLIELIKGLDIKLDENDLSFMGIMKRISGHIDSLKSQGLLDQKFQVPVWATICPYKNEYQNFGVLQSVDILTVLIHLKHNGYKDIITNKPLIAFGSSHGAYISNLLMKLAPNTFDLILDNSSYIKPPLKYFIGLETDMKKKEYFINYSNIALNLFTLTNWTTTPGHCNEFTQSAYEIRDLSDIEQIKQISRYSNKTKIISYHSVFDKTANYEDKSKYFETLTQSGFNNIEFHTIDSQSQLDGKFLKSLDHAMGMSLKSFIDRELPKSLENIKSSPTDLCKKSKIEYTTSLKETYCFDFSQETFQASLLKDKG